MKKLIAALIISLSCISPVFAQVTTTVNPTIAQLQQKLQGNGITITGLTLTCPTNAYGLYSGGTGVLSTLPSGIVLTTGSATNVAGPNTNFNSTNNSAPGSTLGDNLASDPGGTHDACFITFTLTPTCNTLSINYVFASEEYSAFVYDPTNPFAISANDVFGFVLTGPNPVGPAFNQSNIALVPGTSTPVSINNVNNGCTGCTANPASTPAGPCTNCAYFIDQPSGLVYDGSTTVLTASVQVTPCQAYTMTIGVWDDFDWSYDSGVFLDVNGLSCSNSPTLIATATPSTICSPQTITLTASGGLAGATYTWSAPASGGLVTTVGQTVTANPTASTTYTISYEDVNTCPSVPLKEYLSFTFNPPVTVTPVSSTICAGKSVTLTASGGSGSYNWIASTGTNPPATVSVVVSPTTTTSYTVVSGAGTCTSQAVTNISVTPTPTITITPPSTVICNGSSSAMLASGATNYSWTPLYGLTAYTGPNVTANPTVTTTYTIVGINGSCTNSTTATVSVTTVSLNVNSSASSYCIGGSSVTLNVNGASSYTWAPGSSLSSTSGASVSATPSVSTTYTVTGAIGSCSNSQTISISVTPTPTLSITSTNTILCSSGNGATLTASGANTYTWMPGGSTGSTFTVNPSTTTDYTVSGTSAGGCIASPAIITESVISVPVPTLTASSSTVCLTNTVGISANPSSGYTYNWLPVTAIFSSNTSYSIVAKPTTTATVIYTLSISSGACVKTNTIMLQVFSCIPPTADFTTSTNDSICTNGCVTFSNLTSGDSPITYQWIFPGGNPPTSTSKDPQVCYAAAGNYSVGLIATNAYGSDTLIKNNYINVADTPNVRALKDTVIQYGHSTPVSVSGALTYQWYPVDGSLACSTCSNTIASPTMTTMYIVEGANSPYCKNRDTIFVAVELICGDFFVPNAFSPNNDGLNETINVHGICVQTFILQIFNRWGEKVFETNSKENSWDGTYKGKPLDTGVFVYKVDGQTIEGKAFSLKGNITLIR